MVLPGQDQGALTRGEGELPPNGPDDRKSKIIRDLLIWKYVFMGMLFTTAPDDNELVTSGV